MAHLTNPLATTSQLYQHHSSPLPPDIHDAVFIATQCLTQAAGQLLELPQSVTAQANVILARFWLVTSPMEHEFSDASAAAIYLVAKVGPIPRSTRDVYNVYAYLLSRDSTLFRTGSRSSEPPPPDDARPCYRSEGDYSAFRTRLLALEARILYGLSFDTHVSLPHALAITYLQTLDFFSQPSSSVSRRSMQYLNTALLSPQMLYLTHQPHALATAAIYNAARDLGAKMPGCEWWEVFDVDREELGFLVVGMRSVEGCTRQRRAELPDLLERVPTRCSVQLELEKRRVLVLYRGVLGKMRLDVEEDEVMRMMDGKEAK